MTQEEVIRTIAAAVEGAPGIRALFLSGSHATGTADAHSDIDFVMVSEDGASDAAAAVWRAAVERTGEVVLWWDRTGVPTLINAVTADWARTDVLILTPEQVARHPKESLKPLFDPDGLHDTLAGAAPARPPDPAAALRAFENFIRILGLLHLVVGREEYLNGVLGLHHLRSALVELMIQETGAPNRGGILHLNRLITAEQRAALAALPPPVPERQALIDAHLAYAAAYLPRARRRAAALGVDWPEAFEAATWAMLHEALGVERPYDPEAPALGKPAPA